MTGPVRIETDWPLDDSPELRSLRPLQSFDAYAGHMRRFGDMKGVPLELLEDLITCLPEIVYSSERARRLGLVAPDLLYRALARIEVLDKFTRQLARTVVAYYFDELGRRGIRCFYLVDNSIADDRFAAIVELLGLAHFEVVSPYGQSTRWIDLEPRLRTCIAERKHIAYIEKDATVNYLANVKMVAASSGYAVTFRHQASETPEVEVLHPPSSHDIHGTHGMIFERGVSRAERLEQMRNYFGIRDDVPGE